jgi:hypothetical protein
MDVEDIWEIAHALPQVTEEPHFAFTSFRVRGKIFATVPPDRLHLHVFVDDADTDAAVAASPAVAELFWGRKRCGVRVTIAEVDRAQVAALLAASWRRKAPKRVWPG